MEADAVFEGGGVKGIAFVGALEEMEQAGYKWNRLAGTSAGAIVAALLASGYDAQELGEITQRTEIMLLAAFMSALFLGEQPGVHAVCISADCPSD